jgi:photosystem II stability/assembly factor-like uncharacterized protein
MFPRVALVAILAALVLPAAGPTPERTVPAPQTINLLPPPTEHWLDEGAEARLREGRRAWIEEIHRTPPGADWREIERANGLARMERRSALLAGRSGARGAGGWTEAGSRNLAGRMHAVALSASGDSLYGGSSLGGIWKADRNGNGWRPLSDNLYGGTHGIAVGAGLPEVITRITDDGLLHYTEDGGETWQVPAGPVANIEEGGRVARDFSDPDRVYLMLRKPFGWRLYRSDDGGRSYERVRLLPGLPGDFWLDRQTGGRVYLVEGLDVYKSDDLGVTWDPVGTIPATSPSDVLLTGSEAGAPHLYAALRESGPWKLYRSTDAGATWSYRHDIQDFWETMAASITDPDLVLCGGVELWRSTDGGGSFTRVNGWAEYYGDPVNKLHADLPGLDAVWSPGGQEIFYIATDGGLYRSDDGVASVTNISLEYLGVSQYYSTLTSINDPDLILAGSQDQGYQRSTGPAVGNWRDFDQLISGDYGHLTSRRGTHGRVYSVYPGFVLQQRNESSPSLSQLDFPAGAAHSWMPFIRADRDDNDIFYFCGDRLYTYEVNLNQATITPSAQDFTVGGGTYLTAFAIAESDHARRMAVTSSGRLWYSTDSGATWTLSPDVGPSSHYFYGTSLEISPVDADVAYVGGAGYGGPAVYRTTDGGATWTAVGDGLLSTLVFDLAWQGGASPVMYAAAEAGPYRLDPDTDTWESLDDADAPLTTYWCVEAVEAAGVMRFGTYGRGIWDYEIQAATSADPVAQAGGLPPLVNYPNPFTSSTTLRFDLARAGHFSLRVYDVTGRLVKKVGEGTRAAGRHELAWDGSDEAGRRVAAGLYVARLETDGGARIRRITLTR